MSKPEEQADDLSAAISTYDIWFFLAWQDIKIKYRRSKIGPFWITLSMAIFCIALGVVYSRLFKTEISELLPYLAIGLVAWSFIASFISEMPNLFVDNASYIKDMRINPLTILLRVLARNSIVFLHNLIIVLGVYIYFGFWPGWVALLAVPGFILVVLNLAVIGLPLSILGARFRDLAQITQSILQILFFVTPIFWFPRLLAEGSWILAANPVAYFIDLMRSPLLGHAPDPISWIVSIATLFIASIFAAWIFQSKKNYIVFWV